MESEERRKKLETGGENMPCERGWDFTGVVCRQERDICRLDVL
jgi:hypothetical protein